MRKKPVRSSDLIVRLLAPLLTFDDRGIGSNLQALDWLCRGFKGQERLAERLKSRLWDEPPLFEEFFLELDGKAREAVGMLSTTHVRAG